MPRWFKPPSGGTPERTALEREALAEVRRRLHLVADAVTPSGQPRGTNLGAAKVVVGKPELVALAERVCDVSTSARYSAVNQMMQQGWMISLADGTKVTLANSGEYWLQSKRFAEAHTKQLDSATKPPALGELPRGRPRGGRTIG